VKSSIFVTAIATAHLRSRAASRTGVAVLQNDLAAVTHLRQVRAKRRTPLACRASLIRARATSHSSQVYDQAPHDLIMHIPFSCHARVSHPYCPARVVRAKRRTPLACRASLIRARATSHSSHVYDQAPHGLIMHILHITTLHNMAGAYAKKSK
jgi:hypothetical protein